MFYGMEIEMTSWLIGIDPGQSTGLAVLDPDHRHVLSVYTFTFWEAYEFVTNGFTPGKTLVVIEDGGLVSHIWSAKTVTTKRAAMEAGRRIGRNNQDARRLIEGLRKAGFPVLANKPRRTKRTAAQVKELTGFTGKTNEHTRDAIMAAMPYNSKILFNAHFQHARALAENQ